MTLRELVKQAVGDVTFCVAEGKPVKWVVLDYELKDINDDGQIYNIYKVELVNHVDKTIIME